MYPLPTDFDISSLVGSKLCEIAFNANQIRLIFEGGSIVIEGRMVMNAVPYGQGLEDSGLIITAQEPDLHILCLIESEIVSVHTDSKRLNLSLVFSNHQTLLLIGDEPYECYQIHVGERAIIV